MIFDLTEGKMRAEQKEMHGSAVCALNESDEWNKSDINEFPSLLMCPWLMCSAAVFMLRAQSGLEVHSGATCTYLKIYKNVSPIEIDRLIWADFLGFVRRATGEGERDLEFAFVFSHIFSARNEQKLQREKEICVAADFVVSQIKSANGIGRPDGMQRAAEREREKTIFTVRAAYDIFSFLRFLSVLRVLFCFGVSDFVKTKSADDGCDCDGDDYEARLIQTAARDALETGEEREVIARSRAIASTFERVNKTKTQIVTIKSDGEEEKNEVGETK